MQIAVSQISVDARNNEVVKPNIGYRRRMAIVSLMKPILRMSIFPFRLRLHFQGWDVMGLRLTGTVTQRTARV
jgi:hypothetical protein